MSRGKAAVCCILPHGIVWMHLYAEVYSCNIFIICDTGCGKSHTTMLMKIRYTKTQKGMQLKELNWLHNCTLQAHCTLFVAVREHRRNHFFVKKLSFAKHDENMPIHYWSSTEVFVKTENIPYSSEKSTLSRDRLLQQTHFAQNFCEMLANHNKSLFTQYSHFVWVSSFCQFSSLFANSA